MTSRTLVLSSLVAAAAIAAAGRAADKSPATMAAAATKFLGGLTNAQRQQASFPFDSDERLNWHFVPRVRKGLPIKVMSEAQRQQARDLLKTGLSQRGFLTATSIMDLETVLGDLERRTGGTIARDPEMYFFSVFGTPSDRGAWAWRVEGHHVALNFTIVNGEFVAASPSFFGSNPAEVRDGPKKGLRILGQEEDAGRAVYLSLDPQQRKTATLEGAVPRDILTEAKVKIDPLSPAGIVASALTPAQRDLMTRLIEVYTGAMASDLAAERIARLQKAGVDKVAFAWAGETERFKPHYYRVQGPTFLIEYDNTQNDANHIHSVWRDFDGDFGRDLLREHLKTVAH